MRSLGSYQGADPKNHGVLSGVRLMLIMSLSFGMFWYVWGEFSHRAPRAYTNVISLESPSDIIIVPEKVAFFPGQEKIFSAKGVFSYGTLDIPAKWTVQPPDLGKLKCADFEAVTCKFTASHTRVSKLGFVTATTANNLNRAQVTILPDRGNFILFDDVSTSDWFFSALFDISKYPSILDGIDDTEFQPNKPLSRGEWVSWLEGALSGKGLLLRSREKRICRQIFSDVETSSRFSQSLCRFFSLGWIHGVETDGSRNFKPDESITREAAAKIVCAPLCSYLKGGYDILDKEYETFYFDDVAEINEYTDDLIRLSLYGIFSNEKSSGLRPKEFLTRAEGVVLLQRIFSLLDRKYLDGETALTVLQFLNSPGMAKSSSPDQPLLSAVTPSFGDGSEPVFFDGVHKSGRYKMAAYYSYTDTSAAVHGLGVESFPVQLERVAGYSKPQLMIKSFKPRGDLVSFRLFNAGLFSNALDFEVVFEQAPHLLSISPNSGTEREKFLIKGFQMGSQDTFQLFGTVLRPSENSDLIEHVGGFVQQNIDLWTESEIWFSALSANDLKTKDRIQFRIVPIKKFVDTDSFEQIETTFGLSSNSVNYTVDLESKPVFYSLSKTVGSPVDPLEIYGRNFGQSPEIDPSISLSYSCLQKNADGFTLVSMGDVPVSKIEVWENGYVRLGDIEGMCDSLLVADKVSFALSSRGKISNPLEFTLYNEKMPKPILDSISPVSGRGAEQIVLSGRYLGNAGKVYATYYEYGKKKASDTVAIPSSSWEYDRVAIPALKLSGEEIRISIETRGMRSNSLVLKILDGVYEFGSVE